MQDPVLRTINQYKDRPQKQGGLYSLNLGQNNGPYLPKDIMISNKNSLKLIQCDEVTRSAQSILAKVGQQFVKSNTLLEAPEVYDDSEKQYTNYDERYKSKLSASDNLSAASTLQENLIRKLNQELKEYKQQIQQLEVTQKYSIQLKDELKSMNETINNDNITNIKELQPMLKEFHNKLKDALGEEKNESYKLLRELEYLNREKLQIQQSVLFSHKRIMELEKLVGVQKQTKLEFQEEGPIEEEEDGNEESIQENEDEDSDG